VLTSACHDLLQLACDMPVTQFFCHRLRNWPLPSFVGPARSASPDGTATLTTEVLRDKIKGGGQGSQSASRSEGDGIPLPRHDDRGLHADRLNDGAPERVLREVA
jgi:hypothetical protein